MMDKSSPLATFTVTRTITKTVNEDHKLCVEVYNEQGQLISNRPATMLDIENVLREVERIPLSDVCAQKCLATARVKKLESELASQREANAARSALIDANKARDELSALIKKQPPLRSRADCEYENDSLKRMNAANTERIDKLQDKVTQLEALIVAIEASATYSPFAKEAILRLINRHTDANMTT